MREIKFRGYCEQDSEWRIGSLVTNGEIYQIETILKSGKLYTSVVDPDSVGQFTGLQDKHGKDIYEGDITATPIPPVQDNAHIIEWSDKYAGWFAVNARDRTQDKTDGSVQLFVLMKYEPKIIGNIYKNPELMESQ